MSSRDRKRLKAPFNLALATGTLLCLAATIFVSSRITTDIRDFIYQAFNEEQLIIARNARDAIQGGLAGIERELLTAVSELEPDGSEADAIADRVLGRSLARLQHQGVRWLAVCDDHTDRIRIRHRYEPGARTLPAGGPDIALPGLDALAAGEILCAAPVVEEAGVALRIATRRPDVGYALVCELELTRFLASYLREIRSGRTGYAWLIDGDQRFLYHPVAAFLGRDASTVREETYPATSYELINEIQRDRMLRGLEGTSSYDSGHHDGRTGRVEKLIAYTPLVSQWRGGTTWSLAVVAPVGDLQEALRRRSRWNLLLGSVAVALVILASGVILLRELRWRRILEGRVIERSEDLRRSEERYRHLVESSEDAIFTLDSACRVRNANSFSVRFFGRRSSEVEGRPLAELLPRDVAQAEVARARSVLTSRRSTRSVLALVADDRTRWFDASYMPLRGRGDRVDGVLCITRDVTEQRDLERHLMQTEKLAALGTLAAGFAHEINNPLTVMLGFCELMLKRAQPGTPAHEDLKVIERQGEHCRSIMENLLSLARTEGETSEYADLNRAVTETLQVVRHSLEMNHIVLREDLAVGLPPVRGDFRQLQQVLLNLINNAAAAMPEGGELDVTTRRVSQMTAEAEIADTGVGIDPEHRACVFEPFFTTKAQGEGTGLGLFVSYGIVSKYGGELIFTSRLAGETDDPSGTVMTVRLPVQKDVRT